MMDAAQTRQWRRSGKPRRPGTVRGESRCVSAYGVSSAVARTHCLKNRVTGTDVERRMGGSDDGNLDLSCAEPAVRVANGVTKPRGSQTVVRRAKDRD